MAKYMTRDEHDRIPEFCEHVREFYTDEDLVSQVAFMMDHHTERQYQFSDLKEQAEKMVTGGDFLVYHGQVEDFARETHLIDLRLGQDRRWKRYVERVGRTIVKICTSTNLDYEQMRKAAITSIYNPQFEIAKDGLSFKMQRSPASMFLKERANEDCKIEYSDGWFTVSKEATNG